MSVDDRDDRPETGSSPESKDRDVVAPLQSKTDEPLPPRAEAAAERDADRTSPVTPQGQRRRFVTRRNAAIAAIAVLASIAAVIILAVFLYKVGYIDRYVAGQIKDTLAAYGIRAEIGSFETKFSPRTVEMRDIKLYDSQTGAQLGKIDRMLATVRIEDMYAINLRRNVNLQSLEIDGLEAWVNFDEQGRSNFGNLRLPAPDPNRRILFSYSTAHIDIKNSVIHYGDQRYEIAGEARNIVATIEPENPNAPAESWSNRVNFAMSNSTFTYNGRPVNDISVNARGRVNQTQAFIDELVLRSPVAEARLTGTMDDWRALRYTMNVTSTVDLTQASDILQTGATLRGVGNLTGTVTGEGARYQVDGQIQSDALAADNVRLKALKVIAKASGDGASYEANGKAVADLLTAGDFQLSVLQLTGQVVGTGSDFKWLGELRAAAARVPGGTIAGLVLADAVAESRDGAISGNAKNLIANNIRLSDATIFGANVSDVRLSSAGGVTTVTANSLRAKNIASSGANVNGVVASDIKALDRDGTTNVEVARVQVASVAAKDAATGSLNIAGVRLAIHAGRVQGSTNDINVGTITVKESEDVPGGGHIDNVRLARTVFTLEPSGRYRASADLSLGGGIVGRVDLGAARAALVLTNDQIAINNFTADIMNGSARGNAVVSTNSQSSSRIAADFNNLDVGKLLALTGRVVPVTGNATGNVDLTFPGTRVAAASGTLSAKFNAETGTDAGQTPLNGEVVLRATRGLFDIERASLKTAASELSATGRFSFESDDSDLTIALNSTDATELQRVLTASGLFPEVDETFDSYHIALAGSMNFSGTLRGNLNDPLVEGRVSLESLLIREKDVGSLTAQISITPTLISVPDGNLKERDGGGVQFALKAPRPADNNISIDATLDRANIGNLMAALPRTHAMPDLADFQSDVSGRVAISGLPNAMSGNADVRFEKGAIYGDGFDSIVARATFNGSMINVETVDANFVAGRIVGSGTFDLNSKSFQVDAHGENIQLDRLRAFAKSAPGNLPRVTGVANLTAKVTGAFGDFKTWQVTFDGDARNVTINGTQAGNVTLAGRTANQKLNVTLTSSVLGQPDVIAATIDLSNDNLPTTASATLKGADLSSLFAMIMPPNSVRVTGRASGTLNVTGNLNYEDEQGESQYGLGNLRGTGEFSEFNVQVEDVQLSATTPLKVQFSRSEITFDNAQFTGPGTNIALAGTVAIGPGGRQDMLVNGSLNLRALNGISPNVFLSGAASVAVRLGGTYEEPRMTGTASVASASLSALIADERLSFQNLKGNVIFNANQVQIDSLTGTLGGGRFTASGGALLDRLPGNTFVSLTRYRFLVHGDDITVPFPEGFRSTADGDVEINGNQRGQIITGNINLQRAEYSEDIDLATLINTRGEASLTEGGGDGVFTIATQVDLRVEGRDALVVHNNLADVIGSVSLRITGPVEDPLIAGRITATSGTLSFRNNKYEVTRGLIDLPARRNADPILNIETQTEIRGYEVTVNLTGPLSEPNATTRSEPALPQADVVSLITTGNLSSGDSGTSSLAQTGLGTAASLLTDSIINAPAQRATDKLFGLNRFEIDPLITGRGGASPTARLTVGRQINKNLSITYSTNVTSDQNQVLAVEYRVSNRLSFVAQYQQGSVEGLSSRNDNFSFEIRFKKRF